ncbi:MAG: hypothetical protein B7X64_11825 [Halothiobacillus sp. 39-53-45]|nr:MAG: hypothetical protein B7X64_11825 [Halothiobacillus sp. 39-53-45]
MRSAIDEATSRLDASELATETETPPDLAVGLTLAACAIPAARRFRVMVKPNYFEPLNLWALVALTPGNRKSAVQSATTKPLMEWQREQAEIMRDEIRRIESEAQTMQARADNMRKDAAKEKDTLKRMDLTDQVAALEASIPSIPTLPLLWTSDATPERLGTLLGDNAERMALTIGISPQPSVLEGLAAKPGFRGRGLLGRFLYLVPESRLGYRELNTQPMTDATRAAYNEGIRAMLETPPAYDDDPHAMHLLRLSPDARAEWQDFAHHIERQFRPGASLELLTDWGGKAPGAAARIAGVLHCIEHAGRTDALEISTATMQRALEITAVFTAHSIHALGMMGNDEQMAAAKTVWEWMRRGRHWEIPQRGIFNALKGRFPKMDKLTPALDILAERGYIQIEEPERTGAGRPPSPKVIVRPDLREATR